MKHEKIVENIASFAILKQLDRVREMKICREQLDDVEGDIANNRANGAH